MRTLTGLVVAGIALASLASSGAARPAAGGASIANAPLVPFGQQRFGNLAAIHPDDSGRSWEFWKLNLVTGDRVGIDFEQINSDAMDYVEVYPVGTTDYTLNSTNALFSRSASANNKGELLFTAPRTGIYPLSFRVGCCQRGGGYDFNVFAHHALRLFLGARSSVSTSGSLVVSANLADGTAISDASLKISLLGIWSRKGHVLGTATPTNGSARIAFRVPTALRGRIIRLQAKAAGSSYVTTRSRAITARVR
jgi:hypothetical protein